MRQKQADPMTMTRTDNQHWISKMAQDTPKSTQEILTIRNILCPESIKGMIQELRNYICQKHFPTSRGKGGEDIGALRGTRGCKTGIIPGGTHQTFGGSGGLE